MSELSPRLGLPFLMAAQAQKHVTHNEALLRLDQVTQLVLQGLDATDPPVDPDEGQVWALGAAPTGAWAGQGGDLALWFDGAWQFVTPAPGWQAGFGTGLRVFDGVAWVAPDLPALQNLPGVGINASFDATNRLTVAAAATLLTHEGAGHQLKLNKATAADTASLLFQTGFSGRAEMGTAGNDDFAIKVSPDGAVWHDGVAVDRASGLVNLPNGLSVTGPLTLPAASVTRAALTNGAALSVIGRSANSAGAVADIAAGGDHQVMRRSGSTIGFGAVALNQAAAVTGTLPVTNGGTGGNTQATARTGLGLGTAAVADVTTSSTDSTASRLTRTGDAGILGTAPELTASADSYPIGAHVASGQVTETEAVALNLPALGGSGSAPRWWIVETFGRDTRRMQMATEVFGSGTVRGRTFIRQRHDATWHPWREIYHATSALGTVSHDGTSNTGALLQSGGSGANRFARYADGTQICYNSELGDARAATGSHDFTWTFAAAFVDTVYAVSATPHAANPEQFLPHSRRDPTATSIVIRASRSTATVSSWTLMAIGRWR